MTKRLIALLLAAVALFTLTACNTKNKEAEDTILVVGVDATFEEKWNPFLVESAYDHQVVDQIFTSICSINDKNELEDFGGSIKTEEKDDGTVLYTITLKKNMKFTTGDPVTIDDYIYFLYVCADPSNTGPLQMLSSDIEGVKEYYYDDPNYSTTIAGFETEAGEKYSTETISFEDFLTYAKGTNLDGWWDGDVEYFSEYIAGEGEPYATELGEIDASNADAVLELTTKIEYDLYRDAYDTETWFLEKLKADYAFGNLDDGITVPTITGITRVDDYTCTIKYTKIDIYASRGLTTKNGFGNLVPKSYYGDYQKGDVSKILANMNPVGSGPYIWQGFADNIATCTANNDFFLGAPRTGTVRWQYIPQSDILSSLASGTIDIANPTGNKENVTTLDGMTNVRYDLLDNAGYGYLAMNTERVPLSVRKGVWSLMNRQPSVEGYYGTKIAHVIERPMTTVVAEYPADAKPYYEYSRDKALEFFTEAGYTNQGGKLVDNSGKQLVLNCYIGGSGKGEHPAYAMLVQAATDMEALGAELQIQDVDFNVLQGAMNDGTADMWIMAWGSVYDCDKTSQFHSTGGQNRYRYKDAKMDEYLETIVQTIDLKERKDLVAEMLDYAMDQCIEFPLYQRKNILSYNKDNLDMETIPTATAFYDYTAEIWNVKSLVPVGG